MVSDNIFLIFNTLVTIAFTYIVPEDVPERFSSTPAVFSITFTWLPPSIPNGIIIQYNLTVHNINTGATTTYIINSLQDSYIVNFNSSQRYDAYLSAGTVAGYGPPAYVFGRTAPNSKCKNYHFFS